MSRLDLTSQIVDWARKQPDKAAIISDDTALSYGELVGRMLETAARLAALGVGKGDRVGVAMSAKRPFTEAVLGAMAIAAVPVPIFGAEDEIAAIATDAETLVVLADGNMCDKLRAAHPAVQCYAIEALPEAPGLAAPVALSPSDVGMMIYTSGTTSGVRRGVMIPNHVLVATAGYMIDRMGLTDEVIELVIPPLHHAFGLGRVRAVLQAGGTVVLQNGQFSPAAACVALEDYNCNSLASVSSGIVFLVDRFERFFAPLGPQIRWVEIGSLPLAPVQKENALRLMPNARIFMNYGMTEAMRTTFLEFNAEPAKLESVGRAASGNEVKVFDDNGGEVAPDTAGQIFVRGVNMAAGYWRQNDVWNSRIRDGYFDTGDTGYLDSDGYLFFNGRRDDMINVGGEKVSPVEVEDALRGRLPVDTFAVAGIEDPKNIVGQVPALFVEGSALPSNDDVRTWLRGTLAEHKIPEEIFSLESLPRTSTGKVIRSKLNRPSD